jgi:hypothetical protein
MSQIIDFYSGAGVDHRGRKLDEILEWDDTQLEETHDYIQWLFPLAEPSRFNPHAPLLSEADRAAFQSRPELQNNMRRALQRMLKFYGFSHEPSPDPHNVDIAVESSAQPPAWLNLGDHNYLRITRILTSLALLGNRPLAESFCNRLRQLNDLYPNRVGITTLSYWEGAIERSFRV